jgi:predicted enzyme involved in methoxymalonyl-ACP biosynthesis
MDVKQALRDKRFRDSLGEQFQSEIQKYMQNPGCSCNMPLYKKIITDAKEKLQSYYPDRIVSNIDEEVIKLAKNNFKVINCKSDELEEKLRSLPMGRKQIAIARYEDQVTVVVNELDMIY